MADDALRAADDDGTVVDPDDLAAVQAALAGLAFLRPDAPETDAPEPMPEQVWADLSAALAAERRTTAEPVAPTGSSRLVRWGGGLVAASVAVLAVGVGVTVMRDGGTDPVVVAGDAAVTAAAFTAEQPAEAGAAAPEAVAADALAGPNQLSFAGMVPPARMVVDSDMAYTRDDLEDQVADVLAEYGVGSMAKAMQTATPSSIVTEPMPMTGFTSSADLLRDCIDKLTQDAQSTALLVDRSTFEGQDAGVVVAPEEPPTSTPSPDVLVWVVDPDCDLKAAIRIELTP